MFKKCRCHERLERGNKVGKLKEQICSELPSTKQLDDIILRVPSRSAGVLQHRAAQ
jgi:hypothetical protein